MKRILAIGLMLWELAVSAQAPDTLPGRGGPLRDVRGRLFGKVVDSNGKGIRDASVLLLRERIDQVSKKSKKELIKGVATQSNGDFSLEDVPVAGQLTVNISVTGFRAVELPLGPPGKGLSNGSIRPPANGQMPPVALQSPNPERDLGKITLRADAEQLAAVVISSSNPQLRMDIDKKVFSVDRNIVSAGGTAVDVMRNVPSINVDIDGNMTLRNATPQLYIDGRPTTLTLDQIPADAIESVEIITNPSAKFDASGGNAGIVNILLKKNKKAGYNGNVNAGIDKRGGLNGGASLNVRQNKFNFSLSAFGNQIKNRNTSSTEIRNLLTSPNLLVGQDGKTRMDNSFLFGRMGVDYFATNRTTFSLAGIRVHGNFNPSEWLTADSAYDSGSYVSYSERNTINKRQFDAHGLQGGVKYLFPRKGEELTADINIFSGKNNSNALYRTDVFESRGSGKTGDNQQQILGGGTNRFVTIQSDYTRPLKGAAKMEGGVRVQVRNLSNNQGNYWYDAATGTFAQQSNSSANYKNTDNVYAAYASLSNTVRNFGYQFGLRLESSDYRGELTDSKEVFRNTYPVSLFPSVFLSQKLKDEQQVQLSFTRRINRPFFMQLIPFIDSTDQLNWTRGNAGIKPEFTNSVEASYSKTFSPGNNILFSLYYKYSTDLITRYIDTISVGSGEKRPVSTYVNANSSRSAGAELTSQNKLTKWWDVNLNVNVYNASINTENINSTSSNAAMWSWFAKINYHFKLPWNAKLQLSGMYQSKTNLPVNQGGNFGPGGGGPPPGGSSQSAAQGYIKSSYSVDIALQQSFLKNNAGTVSFSVSDVFSTRRFDQYSESDFFIQDSHRISDVPMLRLNFSFRFGQMDMSIFKRKNNKVDAEGTQNMMQSIQ